MKITIKPIHLAFVAVFAAGIVAVLAGAAVLGNETNPSSPSSARDGQAVAASPTMPPTMPTQPELPTPQATSMSAATATATSVVRGCGEIIASGVYLNQEEKQFYLANCLPVSDPTSVVVVTASGATPVITAPAPPVDIEGRIDFIGAVWAAESIPVAYCVNAANPPIGTNGEPILKPAQFSTLVQDAFRTWESIGEAGISFAYLGLCSSDPWDRSDGVNTVGWGWLFESAIGVTFPTGTHGKFVRQDAFGQLYEMDIVIDVRYGQSFDDPSVYLSGELQHILLHEAGHFIGLGHATEPCSVMRPAGIGSGLCWVDIAATAALYPN